MNLIVTMTMKTNMKVVPEIFLRCQLDELMMNPLRKSVVMTSKLKSTNTVIKKMDTMKSMGTMKTMETMESMEKNMNMITTTATPNCVTSLESPFHDYNA